MKIVVIGGSGLIGSKLVNNLRRRGHEVVAASPSSGVNVLIGEGLAESLTGARVVVDVASSPSFDDKAVLEFFETSWRNLLAAQAAAGVGHHGALSVVGADRLPASGYMRAKVARETLIKANTIPYTIVRATQFFEFVGGIARSATEGQAVRLPSALMQPFVSDDVAAILADVALGEPLNGMVEMAGPEPIRMDDLVRRYLSANRDARTVTTDAHARYFGTEVNDRSLTPARARASARRASGTGSAARCHRGKSRARSVQEGGRQGKARNAHCFPAALGSGRPGRPRAGRRKVLGHVELPAQGPWRPGGLGRRASGAVGGPRTVPRQRLRVVRRIAVAVRRLASPGAIG